MRVLVAVVTAAVATLTGFSVFGFICFDGNDVRNWRAFLMPSSDSFANLMGYFAVSAGNSGSK